MKFYFLQTFEELVSLYGDVEEEEKRHIKQGLTEEELALFDIITKPNLDLSENEIESVKKMARELLNTLKASMLVLDWKKMQPTRSAVRVAINKTLDAGLPEKFDKNIYSTKCELVFDHVYDSYSGPGNSVYETNIN